MEKEENLSLLWTSYFYKEHALGLEMTKRVDKYFVKVHFHRITTEYSSWLVDKVADKEADMVAMRKQFLRDNRERHKDRKSVV